MLCLRFISQPLTTNTSQTFLWVIKQLPPPLYQPESSRVLAPAPVDAEPPTEPVHHHPKVDTMKGEVVCADMLEWEGRCIWHDLRHLRQAWGNVLACAAATPHVPDITTHPQQEGLLLSSFGNP